MGDTVKGVVDTVSDTMKDVADSISDGAANDVSDMASEPAGNGKELPMSNEPNLDSNATSVAPFRDAVDNVIQAMEAVDAFLGGNRSETGTAYGDDRAPENGSNRDMTS